MKKIVTTLLLAGLISGAVMAAANTSPGKSVQTGAPTMSTTTSKKHKKHKKHRKSSSKTSSTKPGK